MKKKTDENRLANFVEQRLDLIANHLVSVVRSEHPEELRPLVHSWLANHVACCNGKLCRVSEWAAQTAEVFKKQGADIAEAHRIFRQCRKELIDYCLDNAEEVPGQEVYAQFMAVSDLHEMQLMDYCSRLVREQAAAARRKGGMIVEAVSYPLALLNAQGFIEIANRPFARALGVTPESLAGCDMLALCDSKTVNRMKTALRHRAGSKQLKAFDGALQNGKLKVEARFAVQPLFDGSGFRSGAVVSMETNAAAITGSSDPMVYVEDMLLAALPFPIQVLNEKFEVTYSSESIKTVAPEEYDVREPLCCMLYHRRHGGQRPCLCRQAAKTGQFHIEEFSYPGMVETRWFMVMALPVPDGSGNVKRTITCTYDQTRRKQIQKQLEMEVIVQQRSSLMPQIAVTVAHQLRNPLSVVLGFAEMLAKGMPPNQTGEAVNRILRNAIRCKEIVEELLDFGKGMHQERRILDFSTLLTESVRSLLTPSQSRIIEWHLPESAVLVECIPEQMTQAVFSLVDNALRYAESRVVCTLEVKGDAARFRVADDGPGIPAQNQERVFEPFFTTRRESGALGLGLSLARAVANDCGGSLAISSAASDEPRGACFSLQIPLSATAGARGKAGVKPAAELLSARRILVVDDEADLLDLMKTGLFMRGYIVDALASGAGAIENLGKHPYDAVIIDYLLSGALSGADVYAHIKEHHPQLKDRVLFITADTMNYQTRLFLETTGRPVLEKPFLMADLAAELQKIAAP